MEKGHKVILVKAETECHVESTRQEHARAELPWISEQKMGLGVGNE